MTYPSPSDINTTKGFGEVLDYLNEVTAMWISNMLLITVWFIILIGFYKAKDDFTGGLAVAGYCTFVLALLFWVGGFVSGITLGITAATAIIGTVVLLLDLN